MQSKEKLAESLAIAALRGWFGDQEGFKRKSNNVNRAIKAVTKILEEQAIPFENNEEPKP